jgi:hypothetical protein
MSTHESKADRANLLAEDLVSHDEFGGSGSSVYREDEDRYLLERKLFRTV